MKVYRRWQPATQWRHVIASALARPQWKHVRVHQPSWTATRVMSPNSSSSASVCTLVFGGGEAGNDDLYDAQTGEDQCMPSNLNRHQQPESGDTSEHKTNVYVEVFQEMLHTLIETESHLFSLEELDYIARFTMLSSNAQFLIVKLLLRKPNAWHRLDSLKFEGEMGGAEALIQAIKEICAIPGQMKEDTVSGSEEDAMEEREVVDLTLDDDDCTTPSMPANPLQPQMCKNFELKRHQMAPCLPTPIKMEDISLSPNKPPSTASAVPGPSSIKLEDCPMNDVNSDVDNTYAFTGPEIILAEDESVMDLPALLECLRVEELRSITKQMHIATAGLKKSDLISAIIRASRLQPTLFEFASTKSKVKLGSSATSTVATSSAVTLRQTLLPFGRQTTQSRLRELVLRVVGKCVRVHEGYHRLVKRANVIYFRLTQPSQSLLLPALLSRFKKRCYANVTFKRTRDIWPTREALLSYEEALEREETVDAALAGNDTAGGMKRESKTPGADGLQFRTPVTPSTDRRTLQTPLSTKTRRVPTSERKGKLRFESARRTPASVKIEKSNSVCRARKVKDIFEEVYPHWEALVKLKCEAVCAEKARGYGLERFESGHVLTRIIYKGAQSLGVLGEHHYELRVLESLLAQRRWHRGQRGRWYERRALILEKYAVKDDGMQWAEKALVACVEALEDDDTHIVYRPKLERRLTALEKKLNLNPADRHTSEGKLLRPVPVSFEGIRMCHRAASLKLDRTGRNVFTPDKGHIGLSPSKLGPIEEDMTPTSGKIEKTSERKEGMRKSIWIGRDDVHVHVEALALQWYEDQGFRGLHSETRIITTLFGVLFWDIIFLPIPGAFETPFQTAPLDIKEDTFYHARKDAIEARLQELEDGRGEDIVERIEGEHREHKTWCVGVDWTLLEEGEMVKVVRCLGGKTLSVICRLLCEDYAGRCSGGPDLFMWNADTGDCKFVEVKGPGDNLQENQKIWIDVLLRAQAAVEVCRVCEQGKGDELKTGKKRKSGATTSKRRGKARDVIESDTEEEEMQPMYGSGDEADSLPVIAQVPDFMDDDTKDGVMDLSTPYPLSKKRKIVAEVVISTPSPSPTKRIKREINSPGFSR